MAVIRGVVFDMDDTLYLECDYVLSGFVSISKTLGEQSGVRPTEISDFLWQGFLQGVRGDAFSRLLSAYPQLAGGFQVTDLVELYRNHAPDIRIMSGIEEMLRAMRTSGLRLAALCDGIWFGQELKVQALGLNRLVDTVIYTDKWGREYWKPHTRGFEEIMRVWGCRADELVFVADNPEKDFAGPNQLGWRTIRMRLPGQLRAHLEPESETNKAEIEADSVCDLRCILSDWMLQEGVSSCSRGFSIS
ncbi:MAG: HAD family hydrolase [Armatimonadota bacterium]|nr:HAD family hydrolase [Armatimonadota bacterium]